MVDRANFSIVLIDDEPASRRLFFSASRRSRVRVELDMARGGATGIEAIERRYNTGVSPDLIVIDVGEGSEASFETARRIRSHWVKQAISVLSSNSDVEIAAECDALGISYNAPRPKGFSELIKMIEKLTRSDAAQVEQIGQVDQPV